MTTKTKAKEALPGGVVWVCEYGHVDLLHRTKGNSLDLCATCKEGHCEPRPTLGRRSKEQRQEDRELAKEFPGFAEAMAKRGRGKANPDVVSSEIRITRPGQPTVVVDADTIGADTVAPPFVLDQEQRRQMLSSEAPPDIVFPRLRPVDRPADLPWPPATPGEVVPVTKRVHIVVLGWTERVDSWVCKYEIFDRRDSNGPRLVGFKPLDPKVAPTTLVGQTEGEREPPQVSRAEATALAEQVHLAELWDLRQKRDSIQQHLEDLANAPRDVRFHLEKTLEALSKRISYLVRESSK